MRPLFALPAAVVAAAPIAPAAGAQPASERPWSVEGRLDEQDEQDSESRRYDEYRVTLEAGRRYRISASSDDFDTLIRLFRPGEEGPVAENDDYGDAFNSRVTYTPQQGGEHVLRVLSYSEEGSGAYSAEVAPLPPLPPPNTAPATDRAEMRWQIWEGELTDADPDRDGALFDDYLLTMRAGEARLISLESADFDPLLWVLSAAEREGEPIEVADDSGPGLNALAGFQAEADGDYIVRVTAYGTGGSGAYRLRISDPLIPPPPARPDWTSEASDD